MWFITLWLCKLVITQLNHLTQSCKFLLLGFQGLVRQMWWVSEDTDLCIGISSSFRVMTSLTTRAIPFTSSSSFSLKCVATPCQASDWIKKYGYSTPTNPMILNPRGGVYRDKWANRNVWRVCDDRCHDSTTDRKSTIPGRKQNNRCVRVSAYACVWHGGKK